MFEKLKSVVCGAKKKIVPAVIAGTVAIQTMAVGAFAEDAGGGVDISSVTSSMTSSLTSLVGTVALACAGVVGVGLTIFGLKYAVKVIKSFFAKIAG